MRVPFIASWAKPSDESAIQQEFPIKPGIVHDEFATICDVFPTLLEMAGATTPNEHKIDGFPLRATFAGKRNVHPQKFLMHFPHSHRSNYFSVYREKNRKLIYHYPVKGAKRIELFDLKKDPFEKHNLADTNPEAAQSMIKAMRKALDNADAQYPVAKDGKTVLKIE